MKQLLLKPYQLIVQELRTEKIIFYASLIGVLCFINYFSIFKNWQQQLGPLLSFLIYAVLFYAMFYLALAFEQKGNLRFTGLSKKNLLLLLAAPLVFAVKMCFPSTLIAELITGRTLNTAWLPVYYWLCCFVFVLPVVLLLHKASAGNWGLYGLRRTTDIPLAFLLLLFMLPLVFLAAQLGDFQQVYPRVKAIPADAGMWQYIFFELAYGADFFTVELFFRGLLVIGLSAAFGKDCVLPAALFYFCIHLGKPMPEAVSSFLGGAVLGMIAQHTKSIWGGLVIHLGIAWSMEIFGLLSRII